MNRTAVRWGILSTARIGETAFIPALRQTTRGQLVAISSRSRDRAAAYAEKYDVPLVFDDYESMLASDEIDAVYNPLPNTMHAEWTARAAAHGKHVFCEKPLAVSPAQAQQMIDVCQAAGVILVEAFVFLCHPQSLKLREVIDSGVIGDLVQMQAFLTFPLQRPTDNIRLNKELGGGALLDAGGYPITFSRFVFGEEPVAVQAAARIDPDYDVDSRVSMVLTFPGDRHAMLQTSVDAAGGAGATIFGSKGYIQVPQPYHPREQSSFVVHSGANTTTYEFNSGVRPFTPAIEQFHDCLLEGAAPLVRAENAIGSVAVIEAALESARSGRRIDL